MTQVTLEQVDQSRLIAEWKNSLPDRGRRRHLSYTMDFDTRAFLFEEPGPEWEEESKRLHLENRDRVKASLAQSFGSDLLEQKIANFVAIGTKPFSVVSYHNRIFEEVRRAFVVGAYYPALVGACALGERILNHLLIDLRDEYKNTSEYKYVWRKNSFDNWDIPIDTLEAWKVLRPKAVAEFRVLTQLRHRSVHFNVSTYATLKEDALAAVRHIREIIDQQFTTFGDRPWFIEGTRGFIFIKREWEENPFIRKFYLPTCPFVGPYFAISFSQGLRYYDHSDYGAGDWSDEEFASVFEERSPEQVVATD